MVFFNRNLRNLALEHGLDTVETARMLAMVHVSAADSLVGCWEAKFHYLFWRPQTAIQRADTDGNPDTIQDPTWTHLFLGNHPEYPSGHACFTGAVTRALKAYFGTDRVPWSLTSTVTGTTHSFDRLSEIRAEVANARVWGGLHFRKSTDDGDLLAKQTTHYVLAAQLPPNTRPLNDGVARPRELCPAGPRGACQYPGDVELIHTCYRITDIDRSVAFYEALGFEERGRLPIGDEAVNVFMGLPGDADRLELTYNFGVDSYEIGTGYGHIAVTVDDLDATLERLAGQGIEPERPPYSVREGGSRLCFVRDPDEYRIELIERGGT